MTYFRRDTTRDASRLLYSFVNVFTSTGGVFPFCQPSRSHDWCHTGVVLSLRFRVKDKGFQPVESGGMSRIKSLDPKEF